MAKQYYAANRIEHGKEDGEVVVFEPGDQVTGLSKDDMVSLWQAGALTEVDPNARPKDDRDARIQELEKQLADAKAAQAAEAEEAAVVERPADEDEKPVE